MRYLTEEELKLAPDWADSYFMNLSGRLVYFSAITGNAQLFGHDYIIRYLSEDHYAFSRCKPIPRKPFDITQYVFSDGRINFDKYHNGLLVEIESDFYECAHINKDDAIAIAKHFNLTAEDLK
jgi:hypothetical protein